MNQLLQDAVELEREVRAELDRLHLRAQAARLVGGFAAALGLQLLSGAHLAGWADLRALLAASAWTAIRQWRKTAPQQLAARAVIDAHRTAHRAEAAAAAAAQQAPPPPAGG